MLFPLSRALAAVVPGNPLELAREAVRVQLRNPHRPPASDGLPGGLLVLPDMPRPVVVGDLHAFREHLEAILDHHGNREALEGGLATLLFLGDAFHDDRPGRLSDMADSVGLLETVFALTIALPTAVFYLRGNHDSFEPGFSKGGVPQGALFRKALEDARGKAFVEATESWFSSLPVFAVGYRRSFRDQLAAVHAGPPSGGANRARLVEAERDPDLVEELVWNRLAEEGVSGRRHRYTDDDLAATRAGLGLDPDALFVVGHNPLWHEPGDGGAWKNPRGTKRHLILYSGHGSRAPYVTTDGRGFVLRHAKD
jgi:hypothetical protein